MIDMPPPSSPANDLALLLKAGGDELRIDILRLLSKDSFGVLELCQLLDTKQPAMSHHLKILANAGLVTTRKEGNSIFYRRVARRDGDSQAAVKEALFKTIDQLSLADSVQGNLLRIYQQRASASLEFFSSRTGQFKQRQDLIAAFDVYGPHVQELLENASLPARYSALEVGPGNGEFLSVLGQHFARTIALDTSSEMLQASEQRCREQGIHSVEFVHNDTRHCRDIPASLDCAVINMVLHHSPSPQSIFDDVACALKDGGVLLVCDLCQHNQDWTREACGDLWLGFEPDDLSGWAASAALTEGKSSYFALRNGFQIQIREFIKQTNQR